MFKLLILFTIASGYVHAKQKIKIPSPRQGHSVIYDSANKQMIVFGGKVSKFEGFYSSQTWTFDLQKKVWEEIEIEDSPLARSGHSAIYDSANKQMIIFGGSGRGVLFCDTWVFDIEKKKWKEIETEEVPPARVRHSAIYDEIRKQMIIFSGSTKDRKKPDTWVFDIEKKEWKEIDTEEVPSQRSAHSAIYEPLNKQMIIFGGQVQNGVLDDTWIFDTEKKEWKEIEAENSPPARAGHAAIYDSINKQMVIWGGGGIGNLFSDVWIFDIEKKEWKEIEIAKPIPARFEFSATYDTDNRQILIFSGLSIMKGVLSDIWAFDVDKKVWKGIKPAKMQ